MKSTINFWLAVGLLTSTIIGAGVFALPFIFQIAGLSTGLFYLFFGAIVYIAIHWMYADTILKTEGEHRFAGYSGIYLGKPAFWLSIWMAVVEMIFVLTIYLILSQSFSHLIIASGGVLEKMLIFWFLGSVAVFLSIRRIAILELLISGGILLIILLIFIAGLSNLDLSSWNWPLYFRGMLLPLGPVLFALSGRVAVPAMVNLLKNFPDPRRLIRKAIITGTAIPAFLYGLFVLGILALSPIASEDAVSGLVDVIPTWLLAAIGALGLISLWSSYIAVGLDIKYTLIFDLKLPRWLIFLTVVGGPILLYILGFQSFIGLVSLVGGIFLALEGIFVVLMWLKANKIPQPTFGALLLLLIFAMAMLYEIIK